VKKEKTPKGRRKTTARDKGDEEAMCPDGWRPRRFVLHSTFRLPTVWFLNCRELVGVAAPFHACLNVSARFFLYKLLQGYSAFWTD
jgi:hypothetical protein